MSARDLDIFRQHLERERNKHSTQAMKLAIASTGSLDYTSIVVEAKAADVLERLIVDLKELDKDAGAFIKRTGL